MKYPKLVDQINKYRNYEYNWNGYGAPKFSDLVIESSLQLLEKLTVEPRVSPTGRNSIQFEYQFGEDYYEIEVYRNKSHVYSIIKGVEDSEDILTNHVALYANRFTRQYIKEQ